MRSLRQFHRAPPAFFKVVAGGVLLAWIVALAMAASPQLHEDLHGDADHDHHECVVTHLLAGSIGEAVIDLPVQIGTAPCVGDLLVAAGAGICIFPLNLANGVLEHAPPVQG
jgi:hypothetical protein